MNMACILANLKDLAHKSDEELGNYDVVLTQFQIDILESDDVCLIT